MTHPDPDKLETIIADFDDLIQHTLELEYREDMNSGLGETSGSGCSVVVCDAKKSLEDLKAHLAAQRQGGDADVSFISAVTALDLLAKGCYDTSLSASTITALTDKVRAALLSAQGGVPGGTCKDCLQVAGVMEKMAEYLARIDKARCTRRLGVPHDILDVMDNAAEALTLLTPYLNNGRGG